jgi:hypothetical protein
MAGQTPCLKDEAIGRRCASKGCCWQELMARTATTIRLLKIPGLPLSLPLFVLLAQRHALFPCLLPSFLSLLLLPAFSLYCNTLMPLSPVQQFTLLTDIPPFRSLPFFLRKSDKWSDLLAAQTTPFPWLGLHCIDFNVLHHSHPHPTFSSHALLFSTREP